MAASSRSVLWCLGGGVLLLLVLATLGLAFGRFEGPPPAAMNCGRDFVEAMNRGDVEAAVALAEPALADGVRRLAKERPEIWGSFGGSVSSSHHGGLDVSWTGIRQKTERVEFYELKGRDDKSRTVRIQTGGLGTTCLVREIGLDGQSMLFVAK